MSRSENKLIHVSCGELFSQIVDFAIIAGFTGYFSYGYSTISSDSIGKPLSVCFLISIIISWIAALRKFCNIFCVIKYFGATMHKLRWQAMLPENWGSLARTQYLQYVSLGLGMYYIVLFTPINGSTCDIYSDTKHACISLQILTVFSWISWAAIGLLLLFCCCCCPCICMALLSGDLSNAIRESDFESQTTYATTTLPNTQPTPITDRSPSRMLERASSIRALNNNSYFSALREKVLPVVLEAPKDTSCPICISDAVEGDEWKVLPCKHYYHPTCIDLWINEGKNTCPICRSEIFRDGEFLGKIVKVNQVTQV